MSYKSSAACLKVSTVAVFMLLFQFANTQSFNDLDAVFALKQKQLKTDLVIMVANKDTVLYQKDTKTFSTLRGQAPIGNSSQMLTVALIMMLVDEGKIGLDDRISYYIPEFAKYGKSYITIRHCLSNKTGIQADGGKLKKAFEKKKFESLEKEVNSYAAREIQRNPGEEFRFNTMGINIAARVLEVVTKKKFDMLSQQKLFRPLGMRQTTFTTLDASAIDPSDGARSTAGDLIRFMTMLLNGGMYKEQRILTEASVKEIRKIHEATALNSAPAEVNGFQYALGLWAPEQSGSEASVLTVPSFGGTIPVVDFCRGYSFVYLLKDLKDDQKASAYYEIKGLLDGKFSKKCK
jgi:CubicO group peptidase (beta-lactamase class C family)